MTNLTKQELVTLVVALRTYQDEREPEADETRFREEDLTPMSDDEIDVLCENLNLSTSVTIT